MRSHFIFVIHSAGRLRDFLAKMHQKSVFRSFRFCFHAHTKNSAVQRDVRVGHFFTDFFLGWRTNAGELGVVGLWLFWLITCRISEKAAWQTLLRFLTRRQMSGPKHTGFSFQNSCRPTALACGTHSSLPPQFFLFTFHFGFSWFENFTRGSYFSFHICWVHSGKEQKIFIKSAISTDSELELIPW